MLLGYENQPFSPRDFFMDGETELPANLEDIFALIAENACKDRDAVSREDAIEFGKQVNDHVGSQVAEQQMNRTFRYAINRTAEGPHLPLRVPLNVCTRDAHRNRIDIAGDYFLGSEKPGSYG